MNISIKTTDKKPTIAGGIHGEITIDDFKEGFIAPIGYWSLDDYKKQWKEGLARIKNHDTSCLVTSVQNPQEEEPLINLWALYKINKKIHIHNYLYVAEGYEKTIGSHQFIPENCYKFIAPYNPYCEDGYEISEWVVDFDED